ncbi:hypothetical protein [Nocardia sp. bgisy134]|uniref:hypothetical protein n=1 Tax=Nocardia sp. bgisy134 TaxID=3413789 RepID=UPI003D70E7F2
MPSPQSRRANQKQTERQIVPQNQRFRSAEPLEISLLPIYRGLSLRGSYGHQHRTGQQGTRDDVAIESNHLDRNPCGTTTFIYHDAQRFAVWSSEAT